jgi:hypothetical protein
VDTPTPNSSAHHRTGFLAAGGLHLPTRTTGLTPAGGSPS